MTVGNLFNLPFDQHRCRVIERGWVCTAIRLAVIGGSGLLHQMAFQLRNLLWIVANGHPEQQVDQSITLLVGQKFQVAIPWQNYIGAIITEQSQLAAQQFERAIGSRPLPLLLGFQSILHKFTQNEFAIEGADDGACADGLAKLGDPRVHRRHFEQPGSGRIRRLCRIPGRDVGLRWTLTGSDQPAEVFVSRT